MNFYDGIESNLSLEKDGVLIKIGSNMAAKIARAGGTNKEFEQIREAYAKPYIRQIQQKLMSTDRQIEDILKPAYARGVVRMFYAIIDGEAREGIPYHPSWNLPAKEVKDGLVEFNWNNMLRVFQTPQLSTIWDIIQDEASNASNFSAASVEDIEAAAKN